MMILFTLLTFGLYYPIWFLRRRDALNRLDSPRNLALWPFVLSLVVFASDATLGFVAGVTQDPSLIAPEAAGVLSVLRLVSAIAFIWQAFVAKDILQDHIAEVRSSSSIFSPRVEFSGLMTFFFAIFYLQYIINRDIIGKGTDRAR